MMSRLLEADDVDERWAVLPTIKVAHERRHEYVGAYRLMEHIGKGRWIERDTGSLREMNTLAARYNKEGYTTPLKQEEKVERSRFSVMERARMVLQ